MIVNLIPQLPPAICGVGDYAASVGGKLRQLRPALRSAYVACGWRPGPQPLNETGLRNVAASCDRARLWRAVEELADELYSDADTLTLVVQYSGYGYERNGAPAWLADALERRPPRFSGAKIVTMFHELYATDWPWRRAFWVSLRQQNVAIRIARLSDGLITNLQQRARWLEAVTGRGAGSVASLPVPSTIGEPEEVSPWEVRAPHAVMFGGAKFKRAFLRGRGAQTTAALCRKMEIRTLINIGAPAEVNQAAFRRGGVEVIETGYLKAREVSAQLGAARLALVDYPSACYAKSTVLAAMAAHGTPPIFPRPGEASDGLRFGEHLWDLRSAHVAKPDEARLHLSRIARAVRGWYDGHTVERHANVLSQFIDSDASAAG